MKKWIIWVIIFLFLFSGCETGKAVQKPREPVKIGALLSLTGDAAFYGESELKAIQMAIDGANKAGGIDRRKIKLIVEDIGTLNTPLAINALRKLIDVDHVFVAIGPTWDMPGVSQAAEEEGVILVAADNTEGVESEKSLTYFFSTSHPQRAEMNALADFAERQEYKNIAIVLDSDSFSQTVASEFIDAIRSKNIKIKEFLTLTGDKDFHTVLLKIKTMDADAVLATFATEEPRGPLLKQMKELGMNTPLLGTSSTENADFLDNYGTLAEGSVFYPYPKRTPAQEAFLREYDERYDELPSGPAASNAYDAAMIIITALKQGARNADDMKMILAAQEFPSVTFGKLKFDEKGFVSPESAKIVMKTVKDGGFIEMEEP